MNSFIFIPNWRTGRDDEIGQGMTADGVQSSSHLSTWPYFKKFQHLRAPFHFSLFTSIDNFQKVRLWHIVTPG